MEKSFRIYFNDSFLLISNESTQSKKNFVKVMEDENSIKNFLTAPAVLFDGVTNGNILIVSKNHESVFRQLETQTKKVIAGGGIVFNENNELLLIFRRGKWDLPKGKIEKEESVKDGAVRETEEETGVRIESVNETPFLTYHAYTLKGEKCLKETSWYEMRAKAGQKNLSPQTEEDIEEVRWVQRKDLKNYFSISYPLIACILKKYSSD